MRNAWQKPFSICFAVVALVFAARDSLGAFPLPIPTRPTRFPLTRPHDLGTVIALGSNSAGQTNIPAGLGKCVAVAAGIDFSLALRPDGTVVAWGGNDYGQRLVPAGLSNVIAINAASFWAAAIKEDGTFVEWGHLTGGSPSWLHDVVQISASGNSHTLALRVDGTVVGWGANDDRQIDIPFQANNAVAISAYGNSSAALTADGQVVTWGRRAAPSVSDIGYVAIDQAGGVRLRNNGFVEGMTVPDYVQRDILAISRGRNIFGANIGALIFTPSRFIWLETGNPGIVPGVGNALAVSAGSSHVLGLIGVGPSASCVAAARILNGFVIAIEVLNVGNNYDYVPAVNIVGGGGTGATAVAQVVDGIVTRFTVTNAGRGYTDVPQVQIGSPWFEPTVVVTTNATQFNVTADLVPNESYRLDSTTDLVNWTSTLFVATTNILSVPLETSGPANFVRLIRNP